MILNRRGLCARRQIYVSEDDCTIVKVGYRMSTNDSGESQLFMKNPQQLTIPEILRDPPNDRFPLQYLNQLTNIMHKYASPGQENSVKSACSIA